jgi:hypothetical protein
MKTILTFALALIAATASAKSFLIERIDVNAAKRISPAIVLAEMRISAGKTYSDEQLQQALNRVRRLPFVLFAGADLKPGSTPDARVLRINIEEMANFNLGFDMDAVARKSGGGGGGADVRGNAGYRFFPGRGGTLDATLGDTNESIIPGSATRRDATLAYNAYGLFGTSAYGSVGVGTIFRTNGRHDVNPSALLGIPLTSTQSIEAAFARTTSRLERNVSGIADPIRSFARITDLGVIWLLQTADDPLFARHGLDLAAGPSWQRDDLDLPFVLTFPKPPHVVPGQQNQRLFSWNASAAKFWPLREASAAWGRFDATTTRITGTANGVPFPASRQDLGDLLLGVAHDFGRELGESGQSRTRVELGLGYHLDRVSGRNASTRSGAEVEIGCAYRNRFGIAHVTVSLVAH